MKVAIIGATGYGGAELIRLLQAHPYVNIHSVHSSSQAGVRLSDSFPHLINIHDDVLKPIDIDKIASSVDCVFLATPSGISTELAPKLLDAGVKVIDLSGDFRIKDGHIHEQWYKRSAPESSYVEKAVYGLSEWYQESISTASLIANPGCYPTAVLLGLAPLVKEQLVNENSIIIDAKSGVSGAGRHVSLGSLYSEVNENLKIYKVNEHQHTPEIEQVLNDWNVHIKPISFTTHLVPMSRGIMATIYVEAKQPMGKLELHDLYKGTYENAPFIRVRKLGNFPSTKEVTGTNYCDIGVAYDERTGRITIASVIDNVVKGAAGQAIQNLNIINGWDETTGLLFSPLYP